MSEFSGNWIDEFAGAITICDKEGIIIEMNQKACSTFAKHGGKDLIGKNILDCHPDPAKTKLMEMIKKEKTNIYTIEKNGVKKLIHQSPWYKDGKYQGFVELSLEIPFEMPNHLRS